MIIAALMLLGAGGILIYNNIEDSKVEKETSDTVIRLEKLLENSNLGETEINNDQDTQIDTGNSVGTKTSVNINGYKYIGIVYIPSLNNLAVPIIDNYTDKNLKISACRYAGTIEHDNMVIVGHNYKSAFGKLSKLTVGSIMYFKDIEGKVYKYKCKEIVVLQPSDVYEMQTGDWDLTLFTCTYSNTERLTLRFEQEH